MSALRGIRWSTSNRAIRSQHCTSAPGKNKMSRPSPPASGAAAVPDDNAVFDTKNLAPAPPSVTTPLLSRNSSIVSVPEHSAVEDEDAATAAARAKALSNLVRTPVSSRPSSRATSPTPSNFSLTSDDDVPTHVSTLEQLKGLPEECLSGDPVRPLQHFDESGVVSKYALNPMMYSVLLVLIVEGACDV